MTYKHSDAFRCRRIAVLASMLLSATAPAQDAGARRAVEQKIEFVRQLAFDSPAARRIAASDNVAAKRHFEEGKTLLGRAGEAMKAGELAAAEQAANEAIWSLGRARQLVPDDVNRSIAERVRNHQLMQSAERIVPTFRMHLAHAGRTDSPDLNAALGLIDEARSLAAAERLSDANRILLQAERHLLIGLNRVIGDKTLVYTAHFDSPAGEFDYELERHRSLMELVPLAMDELKPGQDARTLIRRFVERSNALRAQAVAQAGSRQHEAALVSVREATNFLQRALTAAGLVMPTQ